MGGGRGPYLRCDKSITQKRKSPPTLQQLQPDFPCTAAAPRGVWRGGRWSRRGKSSMPGPRVLRLAAGLAAAAAGWLAALAYAVDPASPLAAPVLLVRPPPPPGPAPAGPPSVRRSTAGERLRRNARGRRPSGPPRPPRSPHPGHPPRACGG